jgi:hypothetical protein
VIIALMLLLSASLLLVVAVRTVPRQGGAGAGTLLPIMATMPSVQRVTDSTPDRPQPFGTHMSWLAIRADHVADVRGALGLATARPCNWRSGIAAISDLRASCDIFITPPVDGWVLVGGMALPEPNADPARDLLTPLLVRLAKNFDEVQYFRACPAAEGYAWARFGNGRPSRAFAFANGAVVWNRCGVTSDERTLAPELFELRCIDRKSPDRGAAFSSPRAELLVFAVAARWSLDPSTLDASRGLHDLGILGPAPLHWCAGLATDAA